MTQAEQFKLVANILKTAAPFSEDRIWLQNMIKEYQLQYQGEELRPYLEGLLAFQEFEDA
jgi:N-glycosylase/DNA lyase